MELKIAFFIIVISVSNVFATPAYSQVAKVSLNMENKSLEQVMDEIEHQTEFYFIFNQKQIDVNRVVNIDAENELITDILPELFKGTNVNYAILDRKILLTTDPLENNLLAIASVTEPQQNKITGTVMDKNGPIPGVNVVVTGTTQGTITDITGKYSIEVPQGAKSLTFSFVGMEPQEITIGTLTQINITMAESSIALEEVVVIGYGTIKKSDLTGSVASIKNEEIKAFPTANTLQALSGRSAGLQVKQNNGSPGGSVSIRIRGTNSIKGANEPLYVIDGFPSSSSNLNALNNYDIQSIDILKDASAIAIYGSRGANGVVMITTNQGKAGKTRVNFESSMGFQKRLKKLEMMNAEEYAMFYNEQRTNDGQGAYFTQDQINSFGEGTDWQDLVYVTAPVQNHSLNVSGGNEKTQFSISGGLFDQQGIVKGSDFKRYSIRLKLNHEISKMFSINTSTSLVSTTSLQKPSEGSTYGVSLIGGSILAPPTLSPYNEDGSIRILHTSYPFLSEGMTNPLNHINEYKNNARENHVLSNLSLLFKPVEGLILKIFGGIENSDSRNDIYTTTKFLNSIGRASVSTSRYTSLLSENTISYTKTFNNKHNLSAVSGFTFQDFISTSLSGSGSGFLSDVTETYNLSGANIPGIPSSGYSKSVILSYLGRINYSFNNRYLFTISFRSDGSSKYSTGSKWANFPSAAFAWRISEEDFFKNVQFISDLKLRTSWGITGSQAIEPYATLNNLYSGKTVFGDALYTTFAPSTTLPGDLKWETTKQTDIGLDVGFLKKRIQMTADYYIKNTYDLLNSVILPSSMGFTNTVRNVGEIQNKGIEFSANAIILEGKFRWEVEGNIAFNKNKVKKLYAGQDILGGSITATVFGDSPNLLREGEEMGVFYGYIEDGYSENGIIKYKDVNNDGSFNQKDKMIIGNSNPNFIFGLNSRISFKNFNLSLFIDGSQGNDLFNVSSILTSMIYGYGDNVLKEVLYDHWTPTNTNAKYPKITGTQPLVFSNRYVEDGSYIRLRNIELSYDIPFQKWQVDWIRSAQVYANAQNYLTITKYSGWDPDVNSQGGSNSIAQGIDHFSYPSAKTFTIGIRVGF